MHIKSMCSMKQEDCLAIAGHLIESGALTMPTGYETVSYDIDRGEGDEEIQCDLVDSVERSDQAAAIRKMTKGGDDG